MLKILNIFKYLSHKEIFNLENKIHHSSSNILLDFRERVVHYFTYTYICFILLKKILKSLKLNCLAQDHTSVSSVVYAYIRSLKIDVTFDT